MGEFEKVAVANKIARDQAREWINNGVLNGSIRREYQKRKNEYRLYLADSGVRNFGVQ
jgi:hypothetical protein